MKRSLLQDSYLESMKHCYLIATYMWATDALQQQFSDLDLAVELRLGIAQLCLRLRQTSGLTVE